MVRTCESSTCFDIYLTGQTCACEVTGGCNFTDSCIPAINCRKRKYPAFRTPGHNSHSTKQTYLQGFVHRKFFEIDIIDTNETESIFTQHFSNQITKAIFTKMTVMEDNDTKRTGLQQTTMKIELGSVLSSLRVACLHFVYRFWINTIALTSI